MGPNARKALMAISGEKKRHRQLARESLTVEMLRTHIGPADLVPCVVELTRFATRKLDDDNLAAAFKAFRDGIADALGINDGGSAVTWRYLDLPTPIKGAYSVMARVSRRA
jgi:hypothetical protein